MVFEGISCVSQSHDKERTEQIAEMYMTPTEAKHT